MKKARQIKLTHLKVKVKSLVAEAKIIRHEEQKFGRQYAHAQDDTTRNEITQDRNSLRYHRIWDVRNECRATQLAIAFLKGKPYNTIETNCTQTQMRDKYIAPRVGSMIRRYAMYAWINEHGYKNDGRREKENFDQWRRRMENEEKDFYTKMAIKWFNK